MNDLNRFMDAQSSTYEIALQEIKNGRKQSHWIWFIFPQLQGLGSSYMSKMYAIKDLNEAKAYLDHAILKERLLEITQAVLDVQKKDILDIMGYPDDKKLKSCMTLFLEADPTCQLFQEVLDKYYKGQKDIHTLSILDHQRKV